MNKIDWKRKLTSRKFWLAVVAFVTGIMVAFKVDAETVEAVGGLIMSGAAVVAYIIGEGLADAANAGYIIEEVPEEASEEN
jgi:hypothetical protein